MVLTKIWLIPIFYGLCAISATATKYFFVSLLKSYPHILPFLASRDASLFGECVFAHLVSYSAFLLMLIAYIRHRQTVEYYAHRLGWENSAWRVMSTVIAGIGFFAALCITVIAHCEDPELSIVHDWADTIAFSAGLLYAWSQAVLTWALVPRMCTLRVCIFRFTIVLIETVAFVFYRFVKDDKNLSPAWLLEASLWIIAICFHVFIITFFIELRFSYLHSPKVVFVRAAAENSDRAPILRDEEDHLNNNLH
ncbi:hypothetical protein GCK72_011956 [Caenorhabditis remanei]|uniref:CWH43-like N-terminal domain-containing protein n=1 Tax=Caenorhabditis remanei TaxID=31234 RepID=A0A6A5GLJ6_CAERE|nr:hypothetical protein GCK72_011956 [Caenorhabditis remanei]KAF1755506.1 hypothetical protein GCK72_011956 [Caenorhabditis remanei]